MIVRNSNIKVFYLRDLNIVKSFFSAKEVIQMNRTYDMKDLYKIVVQKLRQDNERIGFECHKGGYKSIHKKIYSYIYVLHFVAKT